MTATPLAARFVDPPREERMICAVCEDEILDGEEATEEGGVIYHYMCCPDDGYHE